MRSGRRRAARTTALALAVLVALVVGAVTHRHQESAVATATRAPGPGSQATGSQPETEAAPAPHRRTGFSLDLSGHSTSDPSSIWVVVDRAHPIQPLDFRPRVTLVRGYQVARAAAGPLTRLLAAGDAARLGLKIASAFRSYAYQQHVHDVLVATQGSAAADRVSAPPGRSEHQTGLAVDLVTPAHPRCDLAPCFATTRAGRWLARNAWRYGFVVRYTRANETVTGFDPEPWHLRYVGRPLAAAMLAAGIASLEQALHVSGGSGGATARMAR